MVGPPTGDSHPIYNAPMLGAHQHLDTYPQRPPRTASFEVRSGATFYDGKDENKMTHRIRMLATIVLAAGALTFCGCSSLRRVDGESFLRTADRIGELNSFASTSYIGNNGARAYLECWTAPLPWKPWGDGIVVVWTPLSELPPELATELRQRKNPWKIERKADPRQGTIRIEDGKLRLEPAAPADR